MAIDAAGTFFGEVARRARSIDSLLCVGLDPHPEDIGDGGAAAALAMCLRIVDATREFAAAYKPNAAFFEALGPAGWGALEQLVAAIGDVPVVLDAKRGDIGSTSAAYARSAWQGIGAGAVTVQPYLGWQAIEPFLTDRSKAIFALCVTTNPGAAELQQAVLTTGERVFERIARQAACHEAAAQIGLVVAGTDPAALRRARELAPLSWFLVPGIGAQGGSAAAALTAGCRRDGLGLLVSASRSIGRAEDPGAAAMALRDTMRKARDEAMAAQAAVAEGAAGDEGSGLEGLNPGQAAIAEALLATGCVQFGSFVLKSGMQSPIYLDLRRLSGSADAMKAVGRAYWALLQRLSFDRVAALPYAGLPLATAACLEGGLPMVYPRKERKDHGRRLAIEGPFDHGDTVVIVDDLATRGTSALEALPSLTAAGLRCTDAVVLVDRQSGAGARLAAGGIALHAVVTLQQLLAHWRTTGAVSAAQVDEVQRFLADTER